MLMLAGYLSFGASLLHIVSIFIGAAAYRFLGAGEEMAQQVEAGSMYPHLLTLGIALVFFVFGVYALSGAQRFRRLPLLSPVLVGIGLLYTLRGLAVIPYALIASSLTAMDWISSAISFGIGIVHLIGSKQEWGYLRHGLDDS